MTLRLDQLSVRLDETNKRLDDTALRLDKTNQHIDTVRHDLSVRMDQISMRLDGTSDRIDKVREELSRRIEDGILGLIQNLNAITSRIDRISTSTVSRDEYRLLEERLVVVERDVELLKRKVA